MITTELVHFRLISMPCCGYMFCCVNPRLPNYCIECGQFVYAQLKGTGAAGIVLSDDNANLIYKESL